MHHNIVIASKNQGKIEEMSKILNSIKDLKINILSLKDYNVAEPEEPFDDFLKNSIHKAKYYASHTGKTTLSEDSGLSIEALGGFPGVRTKHLIEESGGISNAFITLENMLKGKNNDASCFNSAAVLYIPYCDYLITHEAKEYGSITFPPRGNAGFGFDPIFIPQGYNQTFAELGIEIKTKISHRAHALNGLIKKLREFTKQYPQTI